MEHNQEFSGAALRRLAGVAVADSAGTLAVGLSGAGGATAGISCAGASALVSTTRKPLYA